MTRVRLALVLASGLLAVTLLNHPLRRLITLAAAVLDGLLGEVSAPLAAARAGLARLRQPLAATGIGLRALVGALPLAALAVVVLWADFTVTVATIQSWLPVDVGARHLVIAGHPFGLAESAALALTGLHAVFGVLLMETVGLTRFLPLERVLSPRGVRGLRTVCLAALLVLSALSGALAAWRTDKLQQMPGVSESQAADVDMAAPLAAPGVMPEPPSVSLAPSWSDRLPALAMLVLAVVVPLGGAVAAIGFYFVALAAGGVALALLDALLAALALLVQLVRTLIGRLAALLEGIVDLLAAPGAHLAGVVTAIVRRISRRDSTAAGEAAGGGEPDLTAAGRSRPLRGRPRPQAVRWPPTRPLLAPRHAADVPGHRGAGSSPLKNFRSETTMHYSEFRVRVLDAFHRARTACGSRPTADVLDERLADMPIALELLAPFLRELPALVIPPVYKVGLYAWAFRRLTGIAAARGAADLVVAALKPLVDLGTLPSHTWRDLAGTLEALGSPEALRLLRRVPARHRNLVLRDDTLEALAARDREEPPPAPPGPVDLARITTFRQARALAGGLLPPELVLFAAAEGREIDVPDALVNHVLYDGMGTVILALATEGHQFDGLPRVLRAGPDALREWLAVTGTDEALAAIEALEQHPASGPILAWWAEEIEAILTDPLDAFSVIGQALARAAAEEVEDRQNSDDADDE